MAIPLTITHDKCVLIFESVPYFFDSDGINDPLVSALARAYKSFLERPIDQTARKWILKTKEQIERGETTMDMEVRRLNNRKSLWVW